MPVESSFTFINKTHALDDLPDLRDQRYMPNLSILRGSVSLDQRLLKPDEATGLQTPVFGVRNQGFAPKCVGYALAALIDIQRSLQALGQPGPAVSQESTTPQTADQVKAAGTSGLPALDIASADMLYQMAFFHDRYSAEDSFRRADGIRSLRSAIKGFYHHGACLDWPHSAPPNDPGRWQSTSYFHASPDKDSIFPSVEQAKKAREIGLGAYFRLESVLNHYHSALNEAQAILVSANVHDGWYDATPENEGEITWPPKRTKEGSHAVVLTGYDEKGFHVLNSWGPEWGGYKGQAGIGLWRYKDWATNIIDSWVLRLGVKAPEAFGVSTGEQGVKGTHGPIQTGSTPCFELVGHYMHLDDGFHVCTGSYPSIASGWGKTFDYLETEFRTRPRTPEAKAKKYRGMLVWLPGSFEGIKDTFSAAVARKNDIKELGLYPYTIFWCNSFVEKSLEVLNVIFESCKEQAGPDAEHLDSLIESRVQGVGRAFWREMELSAQRAVWGTNDLPEERGADDATNRLAPGYIAKFVDDLWQLKTNNGCELHVVAEGAGALVLHEMIAYIEEEVGINLADVFDTLHLVHPAIGLPRANRRLVPVLKAMNGKSTGPNTRIRWSETASVKPLIKTKRPSRARVYVPWKKLEECLHFGDYDKSLLQLVSRAFEDRYDAPDPENPDKPCLGQARTFLGMAEIAGDETFEAKSAIYVLNRIKDQPRRGGQVSQTALIRDQTITQSIFEAIQSMR
ncbi:hypothetical protein [Tropicimonas sp. S265A]|uniref:hypothetical protein n=1 Tax=Tropicimonas sp. S265A TaxID=3415134 RepID=UPI003C7D59E8